MVVSSTSPSDNPSFIHRDRFAASRTSTPPAGSPRPSAQASESPEDDLSTTLSTLDGLVTRLLLDYPIDDPCMLEESPRPSLGNDQGTAEELCRLSMPHSTQSETPAQSTKQKSHALCTWRNIRSCCSLLVTVGLPFPELRVVVETHGSRATRYSSDPTRLLPPPSSDSRHSPKVYEHLHRTLR